MKTSGRSLQCQVRRASKNKLYIFHRCIVNNNLWCSCVASSCWIGIIVKMLLWIISYLDHHSPTAKQPLQMWFFSYSCVAVDKISTDSLSHCHSATAELLVSEGQFVRWRRGCCWKTSCAIINNDSSRTTTASWTHCGRTARATVTWHPASPTPLHCLWCWKLNFINFSELEHFRYSNLPYWLLDVM